MLPDAKKTALGTEDIEEGEKSKDEKAKDEELKDEELRGQTAKLIGTQLPDLLKIVAQNLGKPSISWSDVEIAECA
ncbi:hypothetical protein LTR17_002543 [Elasticomyces elasticus]|nr:hypothetical protein LTR17_002543 [Elasticomyces elasticus]